MPSSKYVYADADQRTGTVPNRRRSRRIRKNSTTGEPSNLDKTAEDPDETVLDEDKDETILLSDEEDFNVGEEERTLKPDGMDLDERFAGNDDRRRGDPPASPAGMAMPLRGGAKGFLSNDPLTSSTLDIAATPPAFSAAKARSSKTNNERISTKERLRRFAETFDSDESGDDDMMSEGEFLKAMARRQAQRQALLAESQHRTQQQQHSDVSFRGNESFLQTQQQQLQSTCSFRQNESFLQTQQPQRQSNNSLRQNDSEDTARMANHGASSPHNRSISESFAATQPWEEELNSSMMMKTTIHPQNAPQKDCRTQEYQPVHQRKQPPPNNLPSFPQNNPQRDRHMQECPRNLQGKQTLANTQPNHRGLPCHMQKVPHQDHRQRDHQPNHQGKQASYDTQPCHRDASTVENPYHRKQPPPPAKKAAANVPKISLEHLKSGKKSGRDNSDHFGNFNDTSSSPNNEETWQAEAFRSSLLELLRSFPSNYFNSPDDEAMDGDKNGLFATSATANVDDESPHSTTSQLAASAQLQRKRLFDAASRSLARLAIASRHSSSKRGGGDRSGRTSDGSSHEEESPDFNPPSPRSLPSYMSVLNVHDDSSPEEGAWRGNVNATLSASKEVFSGHSVHGRSARTVQLLGRAPKGNGNPPGRNDDAPSSNPFSSWSLEQLAYGSMVLAAQVCHEASHDANFDVANPMSSESESCRVAGFAQNLNQGNGKRPVVSSALVESSLGFLATAFACLESDFVYSVLKSTLKTSNVTSSVTVFDTLSHFAPVCSTSHGASAQPASTIPVLSLLALSRGLEAALFVARYSSSLDPSSACAAYCSPHDSCVHGASKKCTVDTGIDDGGVGWHSALGSDLGLKLESDLNSRPRYMHLSEIAGHTYDFILEYDPMIVDDENCGRDKRSNQRRGNSRGGLYIDTQAVSQVCQGMDSVLCRQPSIMKDRLYAAHVEFLSSMIHAGIVSSWLSSVPAGGSNFNESDYCARTMESLAQKLFIVIETRARLCRSTNQNNPGDSEAVCAASLSLLILALPKHVGQSAPSSLSTSFRQMGNSTGTIEDLLQSPLVRKMAETALSWEDTSQERENSKESDAVAKTQATRNAIHVLSNICMAGGSSLISSHFCQKLDGFLQAITGSLCKRGNTIANADSFDNSSIDSSLLFLLQLHTGLPKVTREFLRNFFEKSSGGSNCTNCFINGLLHISANKSFSASSCASSLLRSLIDGNPVDGTHDRLSEMILNSFDTDQDGSTIEDLILQLVKTTHSSVHCSVPNFRSRWQPRMCSLGDILGICSPSINTMITFASSLSDEVLSLFVNAIERDQQSNLFMDTLSGSTNLSLLFLFASFATKSPESPGISNDQNLVSLLAQQRNVKEKLLIPSSGFLTVLEVAMKQGRSADFTRRALRLQNTFCSLNDERFLAHTFTKASNSMARKKLTLRDKLAQSEMELKGMTLKYYQIESERDNLLNSFYDQRLAHERRLELTRSEVRMAARNVSEIHVNERKQAEERYGKEKQLRTRMEEVNEQLMVETTSDKSRIKELEELLGQERKSRQDFESALERCKNELSMTLDELEQTSTAYRDLQGQFSTSERKVSDLTATNEDAKANLEDTCAKLIKLATIYQSKEVEMDKCKAEYRSALNTANRQADTAMQKYEYAKKQNMTLSRKYEEVSKDLNDIKARRANVQRMRKNAPVAYLNQLHNNPRKEEKKQSRRNPTGKENARR